MNELIKKEIVEYVNGMKLEDKKEIWKEVRDLFNFKYGLDKSEEAYRHIYRENKELFNCKVEEVVVDNKPSKVTIELRDGMTISERMIYLSESDCKDAKMLLKAHGFNPNEFELVSARNNFWGDFEKPCYQSKVSVKPIQGACMLSKEDIIDMAKNFVYKHDVKEYAYSGKGNKALQVNMGDLHIGAFGWEQETGENNDYKITEGKTKEVVAGIKNLIMSDSRIDTLYLVFGGDILHVDNEEGETSGGTQVHMDGRAKKMVQVAYRILSYMIVELAIVPHVYIKVLEGNHSRILEFAIFEGLKNMFIDCKHIQFDNSPMARKAFLYGKNLVGLAHGDLSNKKNYNWLQLEFREMWGVAKHCEIHLFHLHKEESETTEGGITIRRNPTIKPTDHYEYFNAFIGADKKVACYIWDKDEGLDSIRYFRSMFTIK